MTTAPATAPTATSGPARGRLAPRIRLAGIVAAAGLIAIGSQLLATRQTPFPAAESSTVDSRVDTPAVPLPPIEGGLGSGGAGTTSAGVGSDLARIEANVAFWSGKLAAHSTDFIAAEKLGESQIELARATGDLGAYVKANEAFDAALRLDPDLAIARAYKGTVLVALHQFGAARDLATAALADQPNDPTALATLGDASLELGDVPGATSAYRQLAKVAPGAASTARLAHLAFIRGDTREALRLAREAVAQSADEDDTATERLAFYRYQLGDTLLATGDRPGAEQAFRDALKVDPQSYLAHAGLGRALAADGKVDAGIAELSAAIAIVPQPDVLARRADLYQLRNAAGDAKRSADDRDTVVAIAQLSTSAGNVYDRSLALFLANHGQDPERAVALTSAELQVRKDVYGYDASAWALLAAGRPADAEVAIRTALAFGTKDAKILYHAGMIEIALGDRAAGRADLQAALSLDPSFDALQAQRARDVLAGA